MDYYKYRDAIFASDLTSSQKLVALAIGYHYNWKDQGAAYPANRTLSKETSLSIPTIVRAKMVLMEKGWLIIKRRYDSSCEYTPLIPRSTNNEYNNEVNNELNNDNEFSNENSYDDSKNIELEIISIQDSWSDNPSSTIIRTDTAPAEDYWIKKADEIWG